MAPFFFCLSTSHWESAISTYRPSPTRPQAILRKRLQGRGCF